MRKIVLTSLCVLFALLAMGAGKVSSEQRVLDDLVNVINDPNLNKQIKLLNKINRFSLFPYRYTAAFANNKFTPSADDTSRGFVIFAVSPELLVPHNYQPSEQDLAAKMVLFGAKNSHTSGFLGIRPLAEGKTPGVVTLSPLKNEAGDVFPAEYAKLFKVHHLFFNYNKAPDTYYPRPHGLEPAKDGKVTLNLRDDVSESVYLEVTIPESAKPGLYKGEISFTANGATASRPVELTVYDFTLPKLPPREMNWGLYGGCSRKIDFEYMVEHGISSSGLRKNPNDADVESWVKMLRSTGLDGTIVVNVGSFTRNIAPDIDRYKPEWRKIVGERLREFHQKMLAAGETNDTWVLIIYDEPREEFIRVGINLDYRHTMYFYDLIAEYAPGVRRVINPTGDGPKQAIAKIGDTHKTEFPDGVYVNWVKPGTAVELLHVHYGGRGSKNLIALARKNNIPMWGYNDGDNRYAWGLQNFKVGLNGRYTYAYYEAPPYAPHPFFPIQISGYEYPGRHSTTSYSLPFPDGTIWPTTVIKGMRDGSEDYRYFFYLRQLINAKPNDPAAIDAKNYMENLLNNLPDSAYDASISQYDVGESADGSFGFEGVRNKLIDYIMKLK